MAEQPTITLRLERAREGLVKVVWGDSTGAKFPPYKLFINPVTEKANKAREALTLLAEAYRHLHPDYVEPVTNLAHCGYQLFTSLFEDHVPEDRVRVAEPLGWFENVTRIGDGAPTINVYADPILPVPWGLVHGGQGISEAQPYDGFWAVRHGVAALYNGMPPQRLRGPRSASNMCLLSALNEEAIHHAFQHLDSTEKELISTFLDRPVGRAITVSGCRTRWAQVGDRDCIIYFFGHATGAQLHLSPNDILTASTFRSTFRRPSALERYQPSTSYVLSFLNGCASTSGHDAESFMAATAREGFCGFIGADAPVPDRFAVLFGHELLHQLLAGGQSLRQVMMKLWRKHKPMALFYGCYAYPDFVVSPEEQMTPLTPRFVASNF